MNKNIATGTWMTLANPPKDGSLILALFGGMPYVVRWKSWEVGGESLPNGDGSPPDGVESGWCVHDSGGDFTVLEDEPEAWAEIFRPVSGREVKLSLTERSF